MSQEVCLNTVCLAVFSLVGFFFWRASFLSVVIFIDLRIHFIQLNGTVLFVAEVGAEKVSLVSIK